MKKNKRSVQSRKEMPLAAFVAIGVFIMMGASFLNGCSSGKLSTQQGDIRFSIPFDFWYPKEQKQVQEKDEDERQEAMSQEMQRLQAEEELHTIEQAQ